MESNPTNGFRVLRKRVIVPQLLSETKVLATRRKILTRILKKPDAQLTADNKKLIQESPLVVEDIERRLIRAKKVKERKLELIDDENTLRSKCRIMADAIMSADYPVVYTGAGISTAANIPDYRGPNGIWTTLKSTGIRPESTDIASTYPTYAHLILYGMVNRGIIKHIVSQNCDGLHIRSGISQEKLSEIHGNVFVEYCPSCQSQYWRDFDVSLKSRRHYHETGRMCTSCQDGKLRDTIVHFGESGKLKWPLNWEGAIDATSKADVIICVGTSLSVLRRYSCLWPKNRKYKLFIINLQWTPKDSVATLKLNGNCDTVFRILSQLLQIEPREYKKSEDPLLKLYTPLLSNDLSSGSNQHIFQENCGQSSIGQPSKWFGKGLKEGSRNGKKKRKRKIGVTPKWIKSGASCAVEVPPQNGHRSICLPVHQHKNENADEG